ncbi:MAG: ankyrin repeat domain-containing protein [Alphaproteobacteria bacterium]|nr:ankyrin repeat domain-containing protein [Alphaproteobacteria bacterium]
MKKITLFISLFSLCSNISIARVPPEQCFDFYQNTKKEYKDISPAWAEIALQSNIIKNMRLFGHFSSAEHPQFKAHSAFNVRQDTLKLNAPQDAISGLMQYLFPTPNGQILAFNQRDNDPLGYIGHQKKLDLINDILEQVILFKTGKDIKGQETTIDENNFKTSIINILDKTRTKNDRSGSRKTKFNLLRDQFALILTNAVIEEKNNIHKSKYPEHIVIQSLFAFALNIADNSQEIYNKFPWIFNVIILDSKFSEEDYNKLKESLLNDPKFEKGINNEKLIRVSLGNIYFEEKLPKPLTYVTTFYNHNNKNIPYPNCGETSLLNFFYYVWGDRGIINPAYIEETEKKINGALSENWQKLKKYFLNFSTIGSSANRDAQYDWSQLISNLNKKDTDPSLKITYRNEQLCNVQGIGLINMLNVLEKLIPDQELEQKFPNNKEEMLKVTTFKIDRLTALFSRSEAILDWKIEQKKEIKEVFSAVDFTLNQKDFFQWRFSQDSFSFRPAKINASNWLKQVSWDKTPFLISGWMKTQTNAFHAIKNASEIYHMNLSVTLEAAKAIDLILGNRWQNLYSHIPQIIGRSLFVEDPFTQKIIYTLLHFYENGIDSFYYPELDWKNYIPNFVPMNKESLLSFAAEHALFNLLKNYSIADNIEANAHYYATKENHLPMIQWLCDQDSSIIYKPVTYHNEDLIHVAVNHGHQYLIDYFNPSSEYIDKNGTRLLYTCANSRSDNTLCLQQLQRMGAKIKTLHNYSPWEHYAHFNNIKFLIDLIIDQGISLDTKDPKGKTALMHFVQYSSDIPFRYLVDKGANINELDNEGGSVLHLASLIGRLNFVKLLVEEKKFDINQKDMHGNTPLHIAIQFGKPQIINYLIDQGANINEVDNQMKTPLHCLIDNATKNRTNAIEELLNIVNLFLQNGANLNAQDIDDNTALHIAVISQQPDIVSYLLTMNADVNIRNKLGQTPLLMLDFETAYFPAKKNVEDNNIINLEQNEQNIPYMDAYQRSILILNALLKKNADINAVNAEGETILYELISHKDLNKIKEILDLGIDVNVQNSKGKTAILKHFNSDSYFNDEQEIKRLSLLLEYNADLTLSDLEGNNLFSTILNETDYVSEAKKKLFTYLLDNGFSPNEKDNEGSTLLHKSCKSPLSHTDFIKLLADHKMINLNAMDNEGKTPLNYLSSSDGKIASYLISKGADANSTNKYGRKWSDILK